MLEAGPFLVSEHAQNLSRIGLGNPDAQLPESDEGKRTRNFVWGIPWRGNQVFNGQAFCVGGKSLFWGGWSPRLTDDVLNDFPSQARDYFKNNYEDLEVQTTWKEPCAGPACGLTTATNRWRVADWLFSPLSDFTPCLHTRFSRHPKEAASYLILWPLPVQTFSPSSRAGTLPPLRSRRTISFSGPSCPPSSEFRSQRPPGRSGVTLVVCCQQDAHSGRASTTCAKAGFAKRLR